MPRFELLYEGKVHRLELADGTHRLGRATDCEVRIPVGSVSKYHAALRVAGESVFVRDLGSTNGSEVDGQRLSAEETPFLTGTTLRLADVALWIVRDSSTNIDLSRDDELKSRISFRPDEALSDKARGRIMEMLGSLFELLSSSANATEIETAACEFVARWVRADRVVMLEDDGEGTELRQKANWAAKPTRDKLRLSSSIVGQVREKRESVLVANAMDDPNFGKNESIMALSLRSAMAAPLFDNLRVRGILYVDSADARMQYSKEDLQVLTATANAVAIKLRNLTLEGELKTASRIQRAMLPDILTAPPGYAILAHQVMCRAVGGDLYHCLPRPEGRVLLALGDVAGKGMPAALAMGAAIVLLRALAALTNDLVELMQHFHEQLLESLAPEQFLTMFLAELDPATGHIHFVNAGHNPAILLRRDGQFEKLGSTGLPAAMVPGIRFEARDTQIAPGELLVIYSDGIPEATRDGDALLGDERFESCLVRHRDQPLAAIRDAVLSDVDEFLGGEPGSDDVTLLLLRRD